MTHCAIDLGFTNKQSVAALFDPDQLRERSAIIRFRTTRAELQRQAAHHGWRVVIIEQCPPANWVRKTLEELGVTVLIANTNAEVFRDAKHRSKTDRKDAERLRDLFLLNRLNTVTPLSARAQRQRSLIDQRKRIQGQVAASKNAIRALLETQGITLPAWGTKATTRITELIAGEWVEGADSDGVWREQLAVEFEHLQNAESSVKQLAMLIKRENKQDHQVARLTTAPGCGDLIAPTISAAIDDPTRFKRGKQVSAYSGLIPKLHESGGTSRRCGITRHSWSTLRAYLMEAVQCALHTCKDPWAVHHYERLLPRCGRPKKALVALARRYFVRCWLMLKHHATWQELNAKEGFA